MCYEVWTDIHSLWNSFDLQHDADACIDQQKNVASIEFPLVCHLSVFKSMCQAFTAVANIP